MVNPSLIVLYGQDRRLVETRQWVIQSAGLRVRTAVNLIELESISLLEQIDLFLLCDSLPSMKRKQALAILQTRWPGAPCVVLVPGVIQSDLDYDGYVFQAGDGPDKLLKMIHQLLAGSQPAMQGANNQPNGF